MTALRALATWVKEPAWPRLKCPSCKTGRVGFEAAQKQLDSASLELSERIRRNLEGPDELSGTFIGTLRCDHHQCEGQLAMAGDWLHSVDFDDAMGRERWFDFYRVRYLNPSLPIIDPPEATPASVKTAIEAASDLLWLNPNAAANQLRQAVELLLSARGVRKTEINKRGVRLTLSTHKRIVAYRSLRPDVADALEAVKWIGNSGSHDSELTVEDVLVGARYLDLALRRLYDRTDAKLLAGAKAVNRRRGVARRPVKT